MNNWQGGGPGSGNDYGGGGFLNNSQFDSPSENKKDNIRKSQNLIAATIGQVLSSIDENIKIGRIDANLLRVVARVKSVNVSSTKIKYLLEDDTGTIDAVAWLDGDSDNSDKGPLIEGTYCQAVASVRTQEGKNYLMLLEAQPLQDANCLTRHLLLVIHNELSANKPSLVDNMGGAAGTSGAGFTGSAMNNPIKTEAITGGSIKERILQFIIGLNHLDSGVSKAEVVQAFSKDTSNRQIDEALEFLCNEGQVYTTVDDEHYKSTE